MGVMIKLTVDFNRISAAGWENVYNETLKLINAFEFMDKIVEEDTYAQSFVFTERTKERALTPWYPDKKGWYTMGDMKTFQHAESFMLFRDINHYLNTNNNRDNESNKSHIINDIYFGLVYRRINLPEEIGEHKSGGRHVFDGKTQGYNYHKYLLGIACLIEHRLKPCASVSGDITLAQIQDAVAWVNSVVNEKISLPDRCDYQKLLARIKNIMPTEEAQIESFLELLLSPKNNELGDFLKENFSQKTLKNYWSSYLKNNTPGTIGMNNAIKLYFNMGFGIEDLCDILVLENDEEFMSAPDFIREILSQGILEEEKKDASLQINNQKSKTPETVETLFGKSLLSMAGFRDSTNFHISEIELKSILYKKFKNSAIIDEALADYFQKKDNEELPPQFSDFLEEQRARMEKSDQYDCDKYDIQRTEDLVFFQKGNVILPSLENQLKQLDSVTNDWISDLKKDFSNFSIEDRINALIRLNQSFYINKETWDFMIQNASIDDIFYKIASLLIVKADNLWVNMKMNAIFNNLQLLKTFFLKDYI